MASVTAFPTLPLAGFAWPWGPEPVEVRVAPGADTRVLLDEPSTGWSLWVDPSLPAPAKEGPLRAEAAALREAAAGGPLSHLTVTLAGPYAPAPGASLARRLATLTAVLGRPPQPRDPAERAVLSGQAQPLDGGDAQVTAALRAWLDARVVLYRERVVENPPTHAPGPTPRLGEDPEAFWSAVAGAGLDAADSTRARDRLRALAAAGLHAQWTLAATRGRAVHVGLCAPDQAASLRATLTEFSYEPLPCSLTATEALALDPGDPA